MKAGKVELNHVIYTEEKRSDVSLGAHLVRDACKGRMNVALLLSNDSDLQTPVKMAEEEDVSVITVNPYGHSKQAQHLLGTDQRTLNRRLLKQSQLPDPVTTGDGYEIYRPKEWVC